MLHVFKGNKEKQVEEGWRAISGAQPRGAQSDRGRKRSKALLSGFLK